MQTNVIHISGGKEQNFIIMNYLIDLIKNENMQHVYFFQPLNIQFSIKVTHHLINIVVERLLSSSLFYTNNNIYFIKLFILENKQKPVLTLVYSGRDDLVRRSVEDQQTQHVQVPHAIHAC